MANKKSATINQNRDDDGGGGSVGAGSWSDLTHDVLFLVMMQLGVIDFVAFSGVCKSWRSFASSYMNTFMVSRPPMYISTDDGKNDDVEWCCHLEDVEERKFKTVVPHFAGAVCVGITCGYVFLFGTRTHDFWLVNLITRHELHFPNAPGNVIHHATQQQVNAILVFSPPIYGCWVFLVLSKFTHEIWYSRAGGKGKGELGAWKHVSSTVPMEQLQFFKGKIYTLHASIRSEIKSIGVMKLDPHESKITLLETKNFPSFTRWGIVCSSENLYVMEKPLYLFSRPQLEAHKLDFGEMKWVMPDESISKKYGFYLSYKSHGAVVTPKLWWKAQFQTDIFDDELCEITDAFESSMWFFPHQCRNINIMDR